MRRIALVGRAQRPAVQRRLVALERRLARRGLAVVRVEGEEGADGVGWRPAPASVAAARRCDLLITLGGDGTVLAGARIVAGSRTPILPVNLGGLGFLANFEGDELDAAVRDALAGRLQVERRSLLAARLLPHGRPRGRALGSALNDVVIKQATTYRALRTDVWAGADFLGAVVSDGIVVASPSGSTAYSLSAGGPVLAPGIEAIVVTPICPHTLGMRPLVLPPRVEIRVRVRSRDGAGASVSLDGGAGVTAGPGDELRVRLVPGAVRFLRPGGRHRPLVLPDKLGWSGPPRRRG